MLAPRRSTLLCLPLALALSVQAFGCSRDGSPAPTPNPGAPAAGAPSPNANAAHYGPHGVSVVPEAKGDLAAGKAAPMDLAGHPCTCGGTCHCGHCAGMIAGCHCKPKRSDGK